MPGSNIKSEMAGNAIVLTGMVRTPLDSTRADDIAFQFAQANRSAISSSVSTTSKSGGETETQTQAGQGPAGDRAARRATSSSTCSPSRARSR